MNITNILINPFNCLPCWGLSAPSILEWSLESEGMNTPPSITVSGNTGIEDLALAIFSGLSAIFAQAKEGICERTGRGHRYDIWLIGSHDDPLLQGLQKNLLHLADEIEEMSGFISHEKFFGLSWAIVKLSCNINRTWQSMNPALKIYNLYIEMLAQGVIKKAAQTSTLDECIRLSKVINAFKIPASTAHAMRLQLHGHVLRILCELPPTPLASIEQFVRVTNDFPLYSFSDLNAAIRRQWLQECARELAAVHKNLHDLLLNLRQKLLHQTVKVVSTIYWPDVHFQKIASALLYSFLEFEIELENMQILFPQRKMIYKQIMPQALSQPLVSMNEKERHEIIKKLTSDMIAVLRTDKEQAINHWISQNMSRKTFAFSQGSLPPSEINVIGVCSGLTCQWSLQLMTCGQDNLELPAVSAQTRYAQVLTNKKRNVLNETSTRHPLREVFLIRRPTVDAIVKELIGFDGHFHILFSLKQHDCSELPYGSSAHIIGIKIDNIEKKFLFWDVNQGLYSYRNFWEFTSNFSDYLRLFYPSAFVFMLYELKLTSSCDSAISSLQQE